MSAAAKGASVTDTKVEMDGVSYGQAIPLGAMMPGYVQRGPKGSANFQPWAADYLNANGGAIFGTLGEPAAYCAGLCKEDGPMLEPFAEGGSDDRCHLDLSTGRGAGNCSYTASDETPVFPGPAPPTVADEPFVDAGTSACYKTARGLGFAGAACAKESNDM